MSDRTLRVIERDGDIICLLHDGGRVGSETASGRLGRAPASTSFGAPGFGSAVAPRLLVSQGALLVFLFSPHFFIPRELRPIKILIHQALPTPTKMPRTSFPMLIVLGGTER